MLAVDQRAEYTVATHAYPLTERGRKQATLTGEYLAKRFQNGFDVRYVSYYARSRETMQIMYPGRKVYDDPRLAEAQRGIYHSLTKQQIEEMYPHELVRKEREGLYHYRPWGGENWPDVELRIHSFLGTLNRDCDGQDVLIVAHGHWLLLLQRLIHHFSIEEAVEKYKQGVFENASVTHYESFGGGKLLLTSKNIIPWEGKL